MPIITLLLLPLMRVFVNGHTSTYHEVLGHVSDARHPPVLQLPYQGLSVLSLLDKTPSEHGNWKR